MRLVARYLPGFARDVKKLSKKHMNLSPLYDVIELVLQNDAQSLETLRSRHRMHTLSGNWDRT